jgi:hypothetical protein
MACPGGRAPTQIFKTGKPQPGNTPPSRLRPPVLHSKTGHAQRAASPAGAQAGGGSAPLHVIAYSARQPMSVRLKPSGQSMPSTIA